MVIRANIAEQKRVLDKMFQALEDCQCEKGLSKSEYEFARSELQRVIEKAQATPIPQTVESCSDWVYSVNLNLRFIRQVRTVFDGY